MSLLSEYFEEAESAQTLEKEYGFVVYNMCGAECVIQHMYVRPAYRGKLAVDLADEVANEAKNADCKYLSAAVYANHPSATANVKSFTRYGFKIKQCSNTHIVMTKPL